MIATVKVVQRIHTLCAPPRPRSPLFPLQGASEDAIQESLASGGEDMPVPLTEAEQAERASLLEEGFGKWTKR